MYNTQLRAQLLVPVGLAVRPDVLLIPVINRFDDLTAGAGASALQGVAEMLAQRISSVHAASLWRPGRLAFDWSTSEKNGTKGDCAILSGTLVLPLESNLDFWRRAAGGGRRCRRVRSMCCTRSRVTW